MEAFIWMFKKENFKKHFLFLIFTSILLFIFVIAYFVAISFINIANPIYGILLVILGYILSLFPIFFPLGYFWELVNNIINRESDILANQIYDGKIKKVYIIDLPHTNVFKLIWRGFSSIVANIFIILPYIYLIYLAKNNETLVNPDILVITISILFYLLLPALLWNYAKQNSVVATLNIPKAVFLVGNYTFSFLKGLFFLAIIYLGNLFIDYFFIQLLCKLSLAGTEIKSILFLFGIFLYSIFTMIKSYYFIYVNAYILGTIIPIQEF